MLRAKSRLNPVVGLLPLASGQTSFGMTFPPFLMKQLHRCDSVLLPRLWELGTPQESEDDC
jgi:hypothetical protein